MNLMEQTENQIKSTDFLLFKQVKDAVGENFESQLAACQTDISRVILLKQSFKWVPKVYGNLGDFCKNPDYSTKLRETANSYYRDKNLEQALRGYNLAIMYAPFPRISSTSPTNSIDISLVLALANRSAVWISFEKLEDAILDIDLAFQYGYPKHLTQKLEERRIKCGKLLHGHKNITSMEERTKREEYKKDILFKVKHPNPILPAAENFVDIRVHPLRGRQLIVTSDVPIGTILVVEKPFAKILQKGLKWDLNHCHFCFKTISAGIPCPGCVFAVYCDKTCCDLAEKEYHSFECPCMPYLHISKASAYTRMALRVIFTLGPQELYRIFLEENYGQTSDSYKCLGCDPASGVYDSSAYLPIHHLISHSKDLNMPEKFSNTLQGIILADVLEEFTDFYKDVKSLENFKDFIAGMILHQLERIPCNGISLSEISTMTDLSKIRSTTKNISEIGGGIYPLCSLLNHSCCPNVTRVHELSGGKMSIVATADLKAGDELLTTYTKIFFEHDRKERLEYLENNFNFICDCLACTENWPLLDDLSKIEPKFCCVCTPKYLLDRDGICKQCGQQHDLIKTMQEFNHQIKCFHEADELILKNGSLEAIRLLIPSMKFMQRNLCIPFSKFTMAQDLLKQALDLIVKTSTYVGHLK